MATIIGTGLESYLHRQARERALNRVAEAQEEAGQVLQEAEAEIADLQSERETAATQSIEEKRRRAMAQARLKARLSVIQRREEFMERLWREAESRLRAAGDAAWRLGLIERLLADAAAQLGGGPLELQTNAGDRALLTEETLRAMAERLRAGHAVTELTLAESPAAIWGGVVVRRSDRNELVDNSLNERLAVAKRQLRDTVYHLLTPQRS